MKRNAAFSISLLLLVLLVAVFFNALKLPTNHLDGAFQTASGLYRLNSGQIAGRDFFPYLGIGPTLIVYPIFGFFGADLHASQLSAQFTTILISALMFFVVGYLIGDRSREFALVSVFIYLCLSTLSIVLNYRLDFLEFTINPGNSLRPIRSGLVAIVACLAIIYLNLSRRGSFYASAAVATLMFSIILLWSNDYAYVTLLIMAPFFIMLVASNESASRCITKILIVIIFTFLILTVSTWGGYFEYLNFNFHDVRGDQWWYFPPYSERFRILKLIEFYNIFGLEDIASLLFLLTLIIYSMLRKSRNFLFLAMMGLNYLLGGAVASIGGHHGEYFQAFRSWSLITLGLILLWHLFKIFAKFNLLKSGLIFYVITIPIAVQSAYSITEEYKAILADNNLYRDDDLGGYLNKEWKTLFQKLNFQDQKIKEEYWGLLSAKYRLIPSGKVDSIIHALGAQRAKFINESNSADIITTTNPGFSLDWQTWSLSQNFNFYYDIVNSREVIQKNDQILIWGGRQDYKLTKPFECHSDGKYIYLQSGASKEQVGYVIFNYNGASNSRSIRLIENRISIGGIDTMGYVSLPSSGGRAMIPVKIINKLKIHLLVDAEINISDCNFFPLHKNKFIFGEFTAKTYLPCNLRLDPSAIINSDCSITGGPKKDQTFLMYGPYEPIPEGDYEVALSYRNDGYKVSTLGVFDILGHGKDGAVELGKIEIPFCLERNCKIKVKYSSKQYGILKTEFRVRLYSQSKINVSNVSVGKL